MSWPAQCGLLPHPRLCPARACEAKRCEGWGSRGGPGGRQPPPYSQGRSITCRWRSWPSHVPDIHDKPLGKTREADRPHQRNTNTCAQKGGASAWCLPCSQERHQKPKREHAAERAPWRMAVHIGIPNAPCKHERCAHRTIHCRKCRWQFHPAKHDWDLLSGAGHGLRRLHYAPLCGDSTKRLTITRARAPGVAQAAAPALQHHPRRASRSPRSVGQCFCVALSPKPAAAAPSRRSASFRSCPFFCSHR